MPFPFKLKYLLKIHLQKLGSLPVIPTRCPRFCCPKIDEVVLLIPIVDVSDYHFTGCDWNSLKMVKKRSMSVCWRFKTTGYLVNIPFNDVHMLKSLRWKDHGKLSTIGCENYPPQKSIVLSYPVGIDSEIFPYPVRCPAPSSRSFQSWPGNLYIFQHPRRKWTPKRNSKIDSLKILHLEW